MVLAVQRLWMVCLACVSVQMDGLRMSACGAQRGTAHVFDRSAGATSERPAGTRSRVASARPASLPGSRRKRRGGHIQDVHALAAPAVMDLLTMTRARRGRMTARRWRDTAKRAIGSGAASAARQCLRAAEKSTKAATGRFAVKRAGAKAISGRVNAQVASHIR